MPNLIFKYIYDKEKKYNMLKIIMSKSENISVLNKLKCLNSNYLRYTRKNCHEYFQYVNI